MHGAVDAQNAKHGEKILLSGGHPMSEPTLDEQAEYKRAVATLCYIVNNAPYRYEDDTVLVRLTFECIEQSRALLKSIASKA